MEPYEPRFVTHRLWRDPAGEPWCLDMQWCQIGQRWECIGLTIRSYATEAEDDPLRAVDGELKGLQAVDLRAIPLGSILAEGRQSWRQAWEHILELSLEQPEPKYVETWRKAVAAASREGARGRPAHYPPEHWAEVARVYGIAFDNKRRPTKAVADHFDVNPSTAAKWVARCRHEFHLLGKTDQRKAGGVIPDDEREDQ